MPAESADQSETSLDVSIDNSSCYIGYDGQDDAPRSDYNVRSLGPWEVDLPPGPLDDKQLFVRCYFTYGVRDV